MTQLHNSDLPWPNESAAGPREPSGVLEVPGSNILLDLHGDPLRAQLVVYSDGNHHMALEETLSGFLAANPQVGDIFYATTPPRIIIDALRSGVLSSGNIALSLRPHVFISPRDIMKKLAQEGAVGETRPFMCSAGLSILVAKENPKKIAAPIDLLRDDVTLALSNPVTETASFEIYERALLAFASNAGHDAERVREHLHSDVVVKSTVIHHREIPQIIASGRADASLIYHHLALRYTRIFPGTFALVPVDLSGVDCAAECLTNYNMALVGDGGPFGARLLDHLASYEAVSAYRRHGLQQPIP